MPEKHVVAAGDRASAEAAREILWLKGNAFDAAVAAVFTSMVAEPSLTSAGGGGHLLACPALGEPILFDFFVSMPGGDANKPSLDFHSVWVDYGSALQEFNVGKASVATPGCVAGLLGVQEKLGCLPLKEVLVPAVRAARDGVVLSDVQAHLLRILSPVLTYHDTGAALFAPGGTPLQGGDRYRIPRFADFLETLALEGSPFFYQGEAARIMAQWAEEEGLLRRDDLAAYRVIERRPLGVDFQGHMVLLNPPPSQSGTLIRRALLGLQEKIAGGPVPLLDLVEVLERTNQERRGQIPGSTTHLSVLDASGNAVSVTTTNGEGCGYLLPELGFMLNNMLGEEDLNPFGFFQHSRGARLPSAVCPTILLRRGRPALITGSSGSKRIRSAIVQVIVNVLCRGMDLEEAIRFPRIHLEKDTLHIEPGLDEAALRKLESRYRICCWDSLNLFFGGANSAAPGRGAGDPRRNGCALVFD